MKFLVEEKAFREVDAVTWMASLLGGLLFRVSAVVVIVWILRLMGVAI